MIGLLLIYFIGSSFSKLATAYNKNKWVYVILGIVTYYLGTALFGLIIGLLSNYYPFLERLFNDEMSFNLFLAVPFGLLCCWIFYKTLKSYWSKNIIPFNENYIIDDALINQETKKNEV